MKLTNLKGVGEKTEQYFSKLGVNSVEDLLEFYPRDYEQFFEPVSIPLAKEKNFAAISGVVMENPFVNKKGKLTIVSAYIADESGQKIKATWFNMPYISSQLKRGTKLVFRGKIGHKYNASSLEQPKVYSPEKYKELLLTLQPIYHLTKGLSNNAVISAMKEACFFAGKEEDFIPAEIAKKYSLCDRKSMIMGLHFPLNKEEYIKARKRAAFEEIFVFLLTLKQLNINNNKQKSPYDIKKSSKTDEFLNNLPFELTNAQKNAFQEIRNDFESGFVMSRLVQGDVGSGKTIIALLAMLDVAYSGYQSALMVPTEVLAVQHYETILELFREQGINLKVSLLTGSMTAAEKKKEYEKIKSGEVSIIVGTHALIQEKVEYNNLAFAITDEQHRFGVKQRESLQNKGSLPHVLVMSATPIPRTLAIILYGDLDISVINELPAERLPIKNCVVGKDYRLRAYKFITDQVKMGHQAYVICPMVEYTEGVDAENVVEYAGKLKTNLPEGISVKYLHGKMKAAEKNEIMDEFSKGNLDVLVSTTVIEVGVNVKNATVMMIEDAQRFGLAALHQLRGRVGRGEHQSYCIMIDTNEIENKDERLDVLNKSNDGFYIASEDLKQRGPGDVLGIRQSGDMRFKIADIYNDSALIKDAKEAVDLILDGFIKLDDKEKKLLDEKCKKTSESLLL